LDHDNAMTNTSMTNASRGWGQPNALVVSGGCDKVLRVWEVKSG
jgi:F-box and WD-40 domain protein CDC4